jgi:hypothetical protein
MRLKPGARPGTYEIVAAIGVGKVYEAYRVKDTRLGWTVAIGRAESLPRGGDLAAIRPAWREGGAR